MGEVCMFIVLMVLLISWICVYLQTHIYALNIHIYIYISFITFKKLIIITVSWRYTCAQVHVHAQRMPLGFSSFPTPYWETFHLFLLYSICQDTALKLLGYSYIFYFPWSAKIIDVYHCIFFFLMWVLRINSDCWNCKTSALIHWAIVLTLSSYSSW